MGKKRGKDSLPPFVPLTWGILNSRAYKDLNHASSKALPYFLGKYKGKYNDSQRYILEFKFPYSEGKRLGFAYSTFYKVIQELVRKGFIDPVDKGGLRSDGKSYNLFTLSRRWETYGSQNFELIDWRCFIPKTRLKATSKSETYSSKKGNKKVHKGKDISQSKAVEVF